MNNIVSTQIDLAKILLFFVWIMLNLVDYATTSIILAAGGNEINPLLAWLVSYYGTPAILWVKIVGIVLIGLLLYRIPKWILCGAIVLYAVVIVHASIILTKLIG